MPSPLLIGAEWEHCETTFPVVNPYDGTTVAEVCLGGPAHLDRAIAAAHQAYMSVARHQPAYARSAILQRAAAAIEHHRADFVRLLIQEAGKPRAFAETEVTRAAGTFQLAGELARQTPGHLLDLDAFASGDRHFGLARRFPLGVVYALTPFNFPLNLVAHKVAPALATGNTVVLKPSPQTPLTALLLGRLLLEAGLPPGQLNIVCCSNDDAIRPLTDERVRMVSFTGSAAVGWKLKSLCGRQRVALELGGNAAAIVHEDADLTTAIPALATGAFAYAGQSCISTQRILVHSPVFDVFRERFVAHVRQSIHTGDPDHPTTTVGPLVNAAALQRTTGWIEAALAGGARLLLGGQVSGRCLTATVIEVPHQRFDLCLNEAFAPVVTLQRYDDFPDALREANDSRYGMHAGVFTRDIGRAREAYETLDVGGVLINQAPTFRADNQPYGGTKDSSFGREGVRYAMEEMTELKSLILRFS